MAGVAPDIVIGCAGGGSNFAGLAFPYVRDKITGKSKARIIAVEPASCPTLTRGRYAYDFGDTGPSDAAGEDAHAGLDLRAVPDSCRRPALSRHGADGQPHQGAGADRGARLRADRMLCRGGAVRPLRRYRAGAGSLARDQGGSRRGACAASGRAEAETILFNLSGHGHFDMGAYTAYFAGQLKDEPYDQGALDPALAELPKVAA